MSASLRPPRGRLAPARDVVNGIVAVSVKELRGRMRGRRAFVILTVHLMLVAGFALMIQSIQERTISFGFGGSFNAAAQIGQSLFAALLLLQTLIVLVLAPAATSGAISLEREKQTLDLLATTPISSLAIVLGKLFSALSWVFLLLVASIPVTALVFTFGGVGPEDLVRGYLVLFVTALGFGTLGLFFSALVKRTQAATVLNLVAALALTAGTTVIFIFWSAMGQASDINGVVRDDGLRRPPEALMYLNPFIAQADVICGTETGFGPFCSIVGGVTNRPAVGFGAIPDPAAAARDVVAQQQFGIARDSFWPRSVAAWVILSVVLVVLSVQLVSPTRRWRFRLPRPRRRPQGVSLDADA
jgi:ABC-2 type transport system permease protein